MQRNILSEERPGKSATGKALYVPLLVCAIYPVFKDPEHENGLLEGRTGLISKLKTARQLEMTQVSGGAIPGNWFVSSGMSISRFGSPVPALGREPAQLSP